MVIKDLTIFTLNQPDIKNFARARNQLLLTATTDWVLYLDSDEILTEDLKREINSVIHSKRSKYFSAYSIRRLDTFMGKTLKHGETGNARFIRLAKRDWGTWEGAVHERWQGRGLVGKLREPIIHHPHDSLSSFLAKIDSYSTLAAKERYDLGVRPNIFMLLLYPFVKFVSNYIFKLGFLDGVPGLIHALMMSWHSFLTHTKLYLLWRPQ